MIRVEFYKQALRLRTYLLLGIVVAFPVLLTLIFRIYNPAGHARAEGFVPLAPSSGLNMALATLGHAGDVVLPLVGVIFAGSAVAEEAGWGTLGYLLVRPVTRGRLLASKLLVVAVLTLAATALATLLAVVAGLIAFGWQPVETPSGTTLPAGVALARVAIAAPYMAWSLAGIMSFGFLISSLSNSPLYAAAGAFGLAVISRILDSFTFMGDVRSSLPTHYWRAWEGIFASPVNWDHMVNGVALQVPYVIVFLAMAWWSFRRKDIVT
ncbi:MAG: ABC transporter permease [Chloroflexi bacterium]|nr:ABC transporter permease [Chloroflexota bacterium]